VITLERDATRAIGFRPAVSAVIFDRRLPPTLLDHHRVRIRDASSRKVAPFIR